MYLFKNCSFSQKYTYYLFRVSFKGSPQINFEAKPKVNDTNVPLMDVLTKALHNILIKEFEVCLFVYCYGVISLYKL